MNEGYNML